MIAPGPSLDSVATAVTTLGPLETRVVEIGGVAITLRTSSLPFAFMIERRYAGFLAPTRSRGQSIERSSNIVFDIEVLDGPLRTFDETEPEHEEDSQDEDLEVVCDGGIWRMRRGDFLAQWDPRSWYGEIRQATNPYALDSVIRIVHSLVLARQGEFLVHAASAIRYGRAFVFAGVSGAGKTTISRLAPLDATLLTDEISYVRKSHTGYRAHGTPFAGELARLGENCSAPLQALYLLNQGPENRIDEVPAAFAAQALMRNILFFARDAELVQCVFDGACAFVDRVPVKRLTFRKDATVWDLIGAKIPMEKAL
jgi:hypothetical protein